MNYEDPGHSSNLSILMLVWIDGPKVEAYGDRADYLRYADLQVTTIIPRLRVTRIRELWGHREVFYLAFSNVGMDVWP